MPIRPAYFDRAAEALTPILHDLPGKIVSIDGTDGAGKTTLGRFLAWYFNVTLLESDNFLVEGAGLKYDVATVASIIRRRLRKPRPIVVEGVVVLRLLADAGYKSDFHIHLYRNTRSYSDLLAVEISRYQTEHCPVERADLVLAAEHE